MITKTDFDAKLSSLNRKITKNKIKHLPVENELKKLKTFDLSYFIGKSHFEEDGTQNYLVFKPLIKYFKVIANTDHVSSNLKDYLLKLLNHLQNLIIACLTPALSCYSAKTRLKFIGSCFKQPKVSYTHGKVVKIYIVYELSASSSHNNDPTFKNCLFGAVTLT